jgi:hypothetical protein
MSGILMCSQCPTALYYSELTDKRAQKWKIDPVLCPKCQMKEEE